MLKYPMDRVSGYVQLSDGQGNQYIPEWDLTCTGESRGSDVGDAMNYCGAFLALARREALYQQMIDDGFEFEFKPRPDLVDRVQMNILFTASDGKRYMQSYTLDKNNCFAPSFDISLHYESLKKTREKREALIKEAANG